MNNFIAFFTEKEGSTAMMHMLDLFNEVEVVHQINNQGWEPLDAHTSGDLSVKSLRELLFFIYGERPVKMDRVNRLYTRTAKLPLQSFSGKHAVGMKMRLVPHNYVHPLTRTRWQAWNDYWYKRFQQDYPEQFRTTVLNSLLTHDVTVFITVRQDLLRWGLSKYHGDGTGAPGHLQFKLATGEIQQEQIGKVNVDCNRLDKIIAVCRQVHEQNRVLRETLTSMGVSVHPLRYELFLEDKLAFFRQLANWLGAGWSDDTIKNVIQSESYLKKVHSDDISEFVENADEVLARFEKCWEDWPDE